MSFKIVDGRIAVTGFEQFAKAEPCIDDKISRQLWRAGVRGLESETGVHICMIGNFTPLHCQENKYLPTTPRP